MSPWMRLALLSIAASPCAAVSFNPTEGAGLIERGDVLAAPGLSLGALVSRPIVKFTDEATYSQVCVKDGQRETVAYSFERERLVRATAQTNTRDKPTFQNITGYLLTGYWLALLSPAPRNICRSLESVPEGPVMETNSSGGRLIINAKTSAGDVVMWRAP